MMDLRLANAEQPALAYPRDMKAAFPPAELKPLEHIQAMCREESSFAMLVLNPEKAIARCFAYINRKAREYAEQEMKDNGVERTGVYGLDIPDGLVYQMAERYYRDENAEEDHKDDETFTPKPFVPAPRKKTQGKAGKKPSGAAKPKAGKPAESGGMEQLTLGVM